MDTVTGELELPFMNRHVPAKRRFGVSPDGQRFVMGIPMLIDPRRIA